MEIKQRKEIMLSYTLDYEGLRVLDMLLKEYIQDQSFQLVEWSAKLKDGSRIDSKSLDGLSALATIRRSQIARLAAETYWGNSKHAAIWFGDRGPGHESIEYTVSGPDDAASKLVARIDEFVHARRQWHSGITCFVSTSFVSGAVSILACLAIKSYLDAFSFPIKAMPLVAGVISGVLTGTAVTYLLRILFPISKILIGRNKG